MIDDLSPNFWKGRKSTDCLLLHYTANESLSAAVDMMRANGTSAHYIVGLDGEVRRIVRETDRAWHAGQSAWNGKDQVNHRSIGIELVNFGWAETIELGKLRRTQAGGVVHSGAPPAQVVDDRPASQGFLWAAYPEALASLPSADKQVARAVQSHCARLGFAPADGIDGAWGKNTEAAVAGLVARHGPVYGLTPPARTSAERRRFAEALRSLPG